MKLASSALLVKWVKDAAMTPVTSSETIPFVPEREQNTSVPRRR